MSVSISPCIPKSKYINRFKELDNRGYTWKDKVYQQLVTELEITTLTWQELLQDYLDRFQYNCVPFPNLIRMLQDLKKEGFHLGMITNGRGQFQLDNMRALGIESFFDTILISEWEGMKKPDPTIFKKALQALNVLPDECIFVGDHPENDVKAAQAVGMRAVWKRDEQWNHAPADFIIDDLQEIPSTLGNLSKGKNG